MAESMFLKEMGQRILLRRKAMKLTQEELAEKLGVSPQMVSNLELGKKAIRPQNLAKVCEILQISADFVLRGTDTKTEFNAVADKMLALNAQELKIIADLIDYMSK